MSQRYRKAGGVTKRGTSCSVRREGCVEVDTVCKLGAPREGQQSSTGAEASRSPHIMLDDVEPIRLGAPLVLDFLSSPRNARHDGDVTSKSFRLLDVLQVFGSAHQRPD